MIATNYLIIVRQAHIQIFKAHIQPNNFGIC